MPLKVETDSSGPYLEVEIWLCDPELISKVGLAKEPKYGCGYVMLQVTSQIKIEDCPACGEEFPFNQVEEWYARLDIAPIDTEETRKLRSVRPINPVSKKP
jgi:hypothetical protein